MPTWAKIFNWYISTHWVWQGIIGLLVLPLIGLYFVGKVVANYAEIVVAHYEPQPGDWQLWRR